MEMESFLNNTRNRVALGLLVGAPFTLIATILGAHGLILGYGGIVKSDPALLLAGILTLSGFVGICGAWWRVFTSTDSMSCTSRDVVRVMLFVGAGTSLSLAAWALLLEGGALLVVPLVISAVGGVLFIRATPKCSNKSLQPTAYGGG